jgi:hypothetical protein
MQVGEQASAGHGAAPRDCPSISGAPGHPQQLQHSMLQRAGMHVCNTTQRHTPAGGTGTASTTAWLRMSPRRSAVSKKITSWP